MFGQNRHRVLVPLLLFSSASALPRQNDPALACPAANDSHSGQVAAKSTFLWSIDSPTRSTRSFLFGTIHVPYDRVWANISGRAKRAFDSAESVVFELELQRTDTVARLAECKQLGGGGNREMLPTEMFDRLRAYMYRLKHRLFRWALRSHRTRAEARREVRRLFPGDWEQRRPVWLLFLLLQLGEPPSPRLLGQPAAPMLDLFLAQRALDLGKQLFSMESAAEQCHPLVSVRPEQVLFAINYTLAYLEWVELRSPRGDVDEHWAAPSGARRASALDLLVEQYKCGTLGNNGLGQIVFGAHRFAQSGFSASAEADQRARQVDNLLVEDLLLRRNERMAKRADQLLRSQPNRRIFFALGAGHLLGERSLVAHLRQLGYWLAPVSEDDKDGADGGGRPTEGDRRPLEGILLVPQRGQALPRVAIELRELAGATSVDTAQQRAALPLALLLLAAVGPFVLQIGVNT